MKSTLSIGTATAGPGQKVWGEIPIADAYGAQLEPPRVVVVNGTGDGPTIYIGAGAHGDEYNAIEAVRRAALDLDPGALRGQVIFVPTQNSAAFRARTRHSPADDKDIDSCYPGRSDGSATEALADLLFQQAVTKADYLLDLHTATRAGWNLTHALVAPEPAATAPQARALAAAFGCKVIVMLESAPGAHLGQKMGWNLDHNLFVQAAKRGIPATIIEFGEGGRLEPDQVEIGYRGIRQVLGSLQMLDLLDDRRSGPSQPFIARESIAVRPATQGLLDLLIHPGERVTRGQVIARVISFPDEVEEVRSGVNGVMIRVATEGVVTPNDRVAVIGAS